MSYALMQNPANQTNLINARLFEKGIRDALCLLNPTVEFDNKRFPNQLLVRVAVDHKGRRLEARQVLDLFIMDRMDGHFKLGKSIGTDIAMSLLAKACEEEPQEITLSIKDISKARDLDNRNRMTVPYGAKPLFVFS